MRRDSAESMLAPPLLLAGGSKLPLLKRRRAAALHVYALFLPRLPPQQGLHRRLRGEGLP